MKDSNSTLEVQRKGDNKMDGLRLNGKVILISGGARSGGISECVVEDFVSQGGCVGLMDVDARGEELAERLRGAGGKCLFLQGDLRLPKDAERFVEAVAAELGPPDIVVNVVGGSKDSGGPSLLETSLEQLMGMYRQNVGTAFNLVREALPYLLSEEGDKSVVLIGSVNGERAMGFLGEFPYACAKSALGGFVRCSAAAYGRYGVRFNLVCPASVPNPNSPVWTGRLRDTRTVKRLRDIYPLRRWGTPDDVSNVVLFLASELSSWITGQTFYVDGGLTGCGGVKVREDGKWWLPVEEGPDILPFATLADGELPPLGIQVAHSASSDGNGRNAKVSTFSNKG